MNKDIKENLEKIASVNPTGVGTLIKIVNAMSDNSQSPLFDEIKEDTKKIADGYTEYISPKLEAGEGVPEPFKDYGLNSSTLNWPLFTALYSKSWVFKKAIDKPAQDMVKTGITLDLDDEKSRNKIYKNLRRNRKNFIKLIQFGRLYGGSVIVLMPNNFVDEDYKQPLNEKMLKKLKQAKKINMLVLDRWYGVSQSSDLVNDPLSRDYGKPNSYEINFGNRHSFRVHHDYILRFEGRTAPNFIKDGELQGWGYAEGSHILNELARDDQLKYSITRLINKSLIEVIKMPGMTGLFMGQDENTQRMLEARLEMVQYARDIDSLTLLDTDDSYEQNSFSGLSGLSDLLEINMWLIAAALDMSGVLYGDLKNGFSNDTEALERYDETILNLNEDYFREPLEKYINILYKIFDIDEEVDFTFNSLLTKQKNKEKMEALKSFQELLSGMLNDGVIDLQRYAKALNDYTLNNNIDFNLDEGYINELKEKQEEESEEIENMLESDENEEEDENMFDIKLKK